MRAYLLLFLLVLALFGLYLMAQKTVLTTASDAAVATPVGMAPDISLQVYQRKTWSVVAGEPVLLEVGLSNGDAQNQAAENAQNQRTLEELKKNHSLPDDPVALARLQERYPVHPASSLQYLDSTGVGLAKEITFRITRDGREVTSPVPRVLAASRAAKGPFLLNEKNSVAIYFGFDDGAPFVSGTDKSPFVIEVIWEKHPEIKFTPVKITGHPGPAFSEKENNERDYLFGQFARLDRHYDQMEKYAQRILARNHDSTDGWELHADALAGQGKTQEAYTAFQFVYEDREKDGNEDGLLYADKRLWALKEILDKK